MPGYYDYKIRICGQGAITNAQALLDSFEMLDPHLHKIWEDNGASFPPQVNEILEQVVQMEDKAEEILHNAQLKLAELFPGHPQTGEQVRARRQQKHEHSHGADLG